MSAETRGRSTAARSPASTAVAPACFGQHPLLAGIGGPPTFLPAGYWAAPPILSQRGQSFFPPGMAGASTGYLPLWNWSGSSAEKATGEQAVVGRITAFQSSPCSMEQPRQYVDEQRRQRQSGSPSLANVISPTNTKVFEKFSASSLRYSDQERHRQLPRQYPIPGMTSFPVYRATAARMSSLLGSRWPVDLSPGNLAVPPAASSHGAVGAPSLGLGEQRDSSGHGMLLPSRSVDPDRRCQQTATLGVLGRLTTSSRLSTGDVTLECSCETTNSNRATSSSYWSAPWQRGTVTEASTSSFTSRQWSSRSRSPPPRTADRHHQATLPPRISVEATPSHRIASQAASGASAALGRRRARSRRRTRFSGDSLIDLGGGQVKSVEQISEADFVECAGRSTEQVELITVIHILHNHVRNTVVIGFQISSQQIQTAVETTTEHPFFVCNKGWSSCSPRRTADRFGLHCSQLAVGDSCFAMSQTAPDKPVGEVASPTSKAAAPHSETVPERRRRSSASCGDFPSDDKPIDYSTAATAVTAAAAAEGGGLAVTEPSRPAVIHTAAAASRPVGNWVQTETIQTADDVDDDDDACKTGT